MRRRTEARGDAIPGVRPGLRGHTRGGTFKRLAALTVASMTITAVAAVAVAAGQAATDEPLATPEVADLTLEGDDLEALAGSRGDQVSRSSARSAKAPKRLKREKPVTLAPVPTDPRGIARAMLAEFGFGDDQFSCLDALWTKESGWQVNADNPSSSAYGIPQALPGSKMSSAGGDWATNPATQIRWGLGYIQGRYGSPCGAWGHSQSVGWY